MAKSNGKNNMKPAEINDQEFIFTTARGNSYEDYGWTEEFVENMLYCEAEEPDHEWMSDPQILNNLGIVYMDGVGVEPNIKRAIKYFNKAIEKGDDLAKCNLADIYFNGADSVPANKSKAFKLYRSCRLPRAYYRVGECYEHGWGIEIDLEKARMNYNIAKRAGYTHQ